VDLGRGSWPDSARPTPDWSEQPREGLQMSVADVLGGGVT
jgi:hypothetical protein